MSKFTLHTPEAAPESSRPMLATLNTAFGFVPNLYATLAESPAALKGVLAMGKAFEECSLSPTEQQIVALVTSVSNKSPSDIAAHSTFARNTTKVPGVMVDALRSGSHLQDEKLQALAQFTRAVVDKRGWTDVAHLDAFLMAGYTKANAIEVVMGVSQNIFANYIDHITAMPLNEQFKSEAWERYKKVA